MAGLALGRGQDVPAAAEEAVRAMEARAAGLADLEVEVESSEGSGFFGPASSRVAWVRGAGLRVTASPGTRRGGASGGAYEFIYDRDALRVLVSGAYDRQSGLTFAALRLGWKDPAARSADPYFLPLGFPVRVFLDDPFLYYAIDPRFFLAREPNLALEGRRADGGRECWVLSSCTAPGPPRERLAPVGFLVTRSRKEFFVDCGTGELRRITWEVVVQQESGRRSRDERTFLELVPSDPQPVAGTLTLPGTVTWSAYRVRGGRREQQGAVVTRSFHGYRANAGLKPGAILAEAERGDLYADAVLLSSEEYAKRDPKDAASRYALALSKTNLDPFSGLFGGGRKPDLPAVAAALERAAELEPKADSPVVNLLGLYRVTGDGEKERALVERIEKGEAGGARARAIAAARFNLGKEPDRALKLVGDAPGAPESVRRLLGIERLTAHALKADAAALAAAWADEDARRRSTGERIAFALEAAAKLTGEEAGAELPEAKLAAALEGTKTLSARIALSRVRKGPGAAAEALAAVLEAAPKDPAAVEFALAEAEDRLDLDVARRPVVEDPAAAAPPEPWPKAASERLARAALALEGPRAAVVAAFALRRGTADADQALEAALERCRAGGPGAARGACLLGGGKAEDAWVDACVEAALKASPRAEGVPDGLLRTEQTNPVLRRLRQLVEKRAWVDAFRLATRGEAYLRPSWTAAEVLRKVADECAAAVAGEVMREEKDRRPYLDFARFSAAYLGHAKAAEALAKARGLWPRDAEILEALARASRGEAAAEAWEAVAALLEAKDPKRADALLEIAQAAGREKGLAALARLDVGTLDGERAMLAGALWREAGAAEKALAAYRRAAETGLRPHVQMGKLHEALGDPYEALREYNRDIAEGSDLDDPEVGEPTNEPEGGASAREALFKRLGTGWLLERFVGQKHDPLGAAEAEGVKKALADLESDDVEDRADALDAIRKIGPRSAPLLAGKLKGEGEAAQQLRRMVLEWAEPR